MANNTTKDSVTFEIIEHIGVLSTNENGWSKEVNVVSWNGGRPKVDIRDWDPSYQRMSRGITLPETEAVALANLLSAKYTNR